MIQNFSAVELENAVGPEWLHAQARPLLDELVLPTAEQETWRYSRINEVDMSSYCLRERDDIDDLDTDDKALDELLVELGEYDCQVIIGSQVEVDNLNDAIEVIYGTELGECEALSLKHDDAVVDTFEVLNTAFVRNPIVVRIRDGVHIEKPIVIVHNSAGGAVADFSRVAYDFGVDVHATVCEVHVSSRSDGGLVVADSFVRLGESAHVEFTTLQVMGEHSWFISHQTSQVERDAQLDAFAVSIGGYYSRMQTDCHLEGVNANSNLRAAYFGSQNQMHDFRTLQSHRAPRTTSDLLFKGAVGDTSRSVYSGMIRIPKGASGTNAFQTNRNLVLSKGAHADSVPNLEIEENDVRASHASAVGPIDPDQLFYLESRGVPTRAAERLVVLGFIDDVVSSMKCASVRSYVNHLVANKFASLSDVELAATNPGPTEKAGSEQENE